MLFPESIEVAAGLVFIYLTMSMFATIANEAMEGLFKNRARNLEQGLMEILCDPLPPRKDGGRSDYLLHRYDMLKAFYDHTLITSLYRGHYIVPHKRKFWAAGQLPSYLPSGHFAVVLLDLVAAQGGQDSTGDLRLDTIMAGTRKIRNVRVAQMVQFAVNNSDGDVDKARQFLELWFNATMERAAGWYKRRTQKFTFFVALAACITLNVNTVVIADYLFLYPNVRKLELAQIETASASAPATSVEEDVGKLKTLNDIGLPLGWNRLTIATMQHLFNYSVSPAQDIRSSGTVKPAGFSGNVSAWPGVVAKWSSYLAGQAGEIYHGKADLADNFLVKLADMLTLFLGWVMTALAITLGAPFWFDVLGKLMVLRSTVKPKDDEPGPVSNGPTTLKSDSGAMPRLGSSGSYRYAAVAALPAPASDDQDMKMAIDPLLVPRED